MWLRADRHPRRIRAFTRDACISDSKLDRRGPVNGSGGSAAPKLSSALMKVKTIDERKIKLADGVVVLGLEEVKVKEEGKPC